MGIESTRNISRSEAVDKIKNYTRIIAEREINEELKKIDLGDSFSEKEKEEYIVFLKDSILSLRKLKIETFFNLNAFKILSIKDLDELLHQLKYMADEDIFDNYIIDDDEIKHT